MGQTYIRSSVTTENTGVVMLSAKELLAGQLNVAAQNLSNGDTIGFKGLMQNGLEVIYQNVQKGGGAPAVSYVQAAPTERDVGQGSLKQTSNPLDIALSGPGYFVIQVNGARQLTRDGRFRISTTGELVTQEGHPVLSDRGPIQLSPYNKVMIGPRGQIQALDEKDVQVNLGSLSLVAVNNEQTDVEYLGAGRFISVGDEIAPPEHTQSLQGFLEQSNVNPVQESVQLMRIMQFYQEAQRIAEMDDTLKSKTMNVKV